MTTRARVGIIAVCRTPRPSVGGKPRCLSSALPNPRSGRGSARPGTTSRAVRRVNEALAGAGQDVGRPRDRGPRAGRARRPRRVPRAQEDPRLEDAWLLAITLSAHKRTADAALDAGADDYLHRPFSRAELLARARAGLSAAQQRADDALMRALMANVPGAIYRSAWHANYTLELISDEIERISGYPAANFIASAQRTLMSTVHPDDHDRSTRPSRTPSTASRSCSSTGSSAPTARSAGCSTAAISCPPPAAACGATARSSTSPIAAPPRRRCARARSSRPGRRRCAHRAPASSRPPTTRAGGSSATCTTARSSGSSRSRSRSGSRARAWTRSRTPPARCSRRSGRSSTRRRPSCASSPAASTPRC